MKMERVVLNNVVNGVGPPSGRSVRRRVRDAAGSSALSLERVLFNPLSVCESECAD